MRPLFLLALAVPAWACQCISWPTATEALADSKLVFIGRVEQTRMTTVEDGVGGSALQIATVSVEEPFKGVANRQQITLRQPVNSCSPNYKEGERLLFYLHPADQENTWTAMGCHRSRAITQAADDLLLLRALPASTAKSRLSGVVDLYEESINEGFHRQRALAGIRVTVESRDRHVETVTNAEGAYEIYGLSPGTYRVSIDVPERLRRSMTLPIGRSVRMNRDGEVQLGANGSAGVDFVLKVNNRMSGRVLGPDDKPMKDLCVYLQPATMEAGRHFSISGCAKSDGRYTAEEMPPGTYRLVLNPWGRPSRQYPFPTVYYPGTTEKSESKVVTIGEGESIGGLDIRVPSIADRVKIAGRMQFRDGTPIPNQTVAFSSVDGKTQERAQTAADGTFQLTIIAGIPGEVYGEIWVDRESSVKCPAFEAKLNPGGWMAIVRTPAVAILGTTDIPAATLAYPFASCSAWHNYGQER